MSIAKAAAVVLVVVVAVTVVVSVAVYALWSGGDTPPRNETVTTLRQ